MDNVTKEVFLMVQNEQIQLNLTHTKDSTFLSSAQWSLSTTNQRFLDNPSILVPNTCSTIPNILSMIAPIKPWVVVDVRMPSSYGSLFRGMDMLDLKKWQIVPLKKLGIWLPKLKIGLNHLLWLMNPWVPMSALVTHLQHSVATLNTPIPKKRMSTKQFSIKW